MQYVCMYVYICMYICMCLCIIGARYTEQGSFVSINRIDVCNLKVEQHTFHSYNIVTAYALFVSYLRFLVGFVRFWFVPRGNYTIGIIHSTRFDI